MSMVSERILGTLKLFTLECEMYFMHLQSQSSSNLFIRSFSDISSTSSAFSKLCKRLQRAAKIHIICANLFGRTNLLLTLNLLTASRSVRDDVSYCFYRFNHFVLDHKHALDGLQILRNFTPRALGEMTHLTVNLCASTRGPWIRPTACGAHCIHLACWRFLDPTETYSSIQLKDILNDWNKTTEYMAKHLSFVSLRLHLWADVEDVESIQMLMIDIPKGEIQLFRNRDLPRLTDQEGYVVSQLLPQSECHLKPTEYSKPFPFLALPAELRLAILEHTDLVAPVRYLNRVASDGRAIYRACWGKYHAGHEVSHIDGSYFSRPLSRRYLKLEIHNKDFFFRCNCVSNLSQHASPCHLWAPPTSIFLVCKQVYDDAMKVFTKENKIDNLNVDWDWTSWDEAKNEVFISSDDENTMENWHSEW